MLSKSAPNTTAPVDNPIVKPWEILADPDAPFLMAEEEKKKSPYSVCQPDKQTPASLGREVDDEHLRQCQDTTTSDTDDNSPEDESSKGPGLRGDNGAEGEAASRDQQHASRGEDHGEAAHERCNAGSRDHVGGAEPHGILVRVQLLGDDRLGHGHAAHVARCGAKRSALVSPARYQLRIRRGPRMGR